MSAAGTSLAPVFFDFYQDGYGGTLSAEMFAGNFTEAQTAALGSRYDEVQAEVNRILLDGGSSAATAPLTPGIEALAQAVIRGEYGNGEERKHCLGLNCAAVQARVSEILP